MLAPMHEPTGGATESERLVSVIIPAHNEAVAIGHCLETLAAQELDEPLDVVVVANGCVDETVAVAASMRPVIERRGHTLSVIELSQPGKIGALNAGDRAARGGIRVYLDADIELSPNAIAAVAEVLRRPDGPLIAAPEIEVVPPATRAARSYATVWSALPYTRSDAIGDGFYAVNAAGRRRWGPFPDIIADDKFVRLQFEASERLIVRDARFYIHFPERIPELIAVRARWCRGSAEVARILPELPTTEKGRKLKALLAFSRQPRLWPHVPVFVVVYGAGWYRAFRQRNLGNTVWERADTTGIRSRPDRPTGRPDDPDAGSVANGAVTQDSTR